MFIGFTTFATTMMTKVTKEAYMDHLCLITPCNKRPYFPKIWVLNLQADRVEYEQVLEILPNQSDVLPGQEQGTPTKKSGKEPEVKDNIEGNITFIVVHERKPADDFMKETTDTETETLHEVFMGYESGAIAIFQAHLSRDENKPYVIESNVLIS